MARAALSQHTLVPEERRSLREAGLDAALERHDVDLGETLRRVRRLQLALIAILHTGREDAGITACCSTQLLGREQPAVAFHHAPGRVDLSVVHLGLRPDAVHGKAERPGP